MIKIKIVVIGKTKEKIYLKKIQEYLKWTSKDIKIELIFLKDDKKEENIIKKLNQYFNPSLYTICLSEEGSQLSSKKFSNLIYEQSKDIVFFIGGPDGHPEEIREKSGKTESEVIKLMRKNLKPGSFRLWRKRVHNTSIKHRKKFKLGRKELREKIKIADIY